MRRNIGLVLKEIKVMGWLVTVLLGSGFALWVLHIWQKVKHLKAGQEAEMVFMRRRWTVVESRIDSFTFRDYQVVVLQQHGGICRYSLRFSSIRPDFPDFEALSSGVVIKFLYDPTPHSAWGGEYRSPSYFLRLKQSA